MPKTFCFKGIILIAGLGCLLTGCSKYDERSALAPALYFEKDNKSIVFTIVKYGKTVSYEQDGGIITKQLSTSYFIQSNDALTGELIANKKIIHNSKVKFYPITCLGQSNGKAWVFMGELQAYDPFTLEKFADKEIIEYKNPQLTGKMPNEKRYYEYNNTDNEIMITATDGIKYSLSTLSLLATVISEDDGISELSANRNRQRQIENLNSGSKSYTSICTASDTFNGKWYGLLSSADLEKPDNRLRYRSVYNETARNQLYHAATFLKDSSKKSAEIEIADPQKINDAFYLQGGFLLNKTNALPIHIKNEDGFIICSREKVGNKGNIILTRINLKGNAKWSFNTNLTEFIDWMYTGNSLIIFGNDNSDISSSEANLLIIIDLQNGKTVKHDYFANAMRTD